MDSDIKHIDNLILRYCEKEASKVEQEELLAWVNASQENTDAFTKQVAMYRKLSASETDMQKDTWSAISRATAKPKNKIALWKYASLAAACFIGVLLSYIYIFKTPTSSSNLTALVITAPDTITETHCPDSSIITINTGSILSLQSGYANTHRNTDFTGYGYFSIKRNKNLPFVVVTEFVKVEVLGTEFCINQDSLGRFIEVSLFEGSVKSTDLRNNKSTILEPGKQVVYYTNPDTQSVVQSIEHRNPLTWKTGIIKFKNTPLKIAIPQIEDFFNKTIVMNDSTMYDCKMYAKFSRSDIEDVRTMFSFSFGFDVETQNDSIILNGKGCGNMK